MPVRPPSAALPSACFGRRLRLLVIAGTVEAAELARRLAARADAPELTIALVPPIEAAGALPGDVRIGGFSRVTELISFLLERGIDAVVDASHPFAGRIADMTVAAADSVGMPRLTLVRPNWRRHPLDRWIEVVDRRGAARVLPRVGKRFYLADPWTDLSEFGSASERFFLVRRPAEPVSPLALSRYVTVVGRCGNAVEEAVLLRRHAIDAVILHATGSPQSEAVLGAARAASLPVVMVRRPLPAPGRRAETPLDALDWLDGLEPARAQA